jgi:hypothetical protein
MCCKKLKKQSMYAVKYGDRQGGFLLWVSEYDKKSSHAFLFMPHPMEALFLSKDEVKEGLNNNQIEFVEELPLDVYEVCRANWKFYKDRKEII